MSSATEHVGIASQTNQRIYYLDNLRAVAMLLGVFLHAALAYAHPAQAIWLATDRTSSVAIDASVWFIHLFRMSLFFLLSGYFARLFIDRKGLKSFLWHRFLRIVVPFVAFYPFLLGAMTLVILFAINYLSEPSGLMGLIKNGISSAAGPQERALPGTMHLWFLYYLMAFSAIAAIGNCLKLPQWRIYFTGPVLFVLCPILLAPAALVAGAPMPAPESFIPHWWPFAFYGLFYFAGWQLYGREEFLDRLRRYAWYLVLVSVALFVLYYNLIPVLDLSVLGKKAKPVAFDWRQLMVAALTAYMSVFLTIASLLLGQRYVSVKNGLLSFISDASYWVYLAHLPIVIFLQTLLVPLELPLILKLIAVLVGTLLASFATYLVFVRYTPVGTLLHGKRSFP